MSKRFTLLFFIAAVTFVFFQNCGQSFTTKPTGTTASTTAVVNCDQSGVGYPQLNSISFPSDYIVSSGRGANFGQVTSSNFGFSFSGVDPLPATCTSQPRARLYCRFYYDAASNYVLRGYDSTGTIRTFTSNTVNSVNLVQCSERNNRTNFVSGTSTTPQALVPFVRVNGNVLDLQCLTGRVKVELGMESEANTNKEAYVSNLVSGNIGYNSSASLASHTNLFTIEVRSNCFDEAFIQETVDQGDNFGGAVAVDASTGTAVVVATEADGPSNDLNGIGAIYVYNRSGSGGNSWSKASEAPLYTNTIGGVGSAINPDNLESAAIFGDYIVVGTRWHNNSSGAVFVFKKQAGVWAAFGKINPPAPSAGARFGKSVALTSTHLIVGAPGMDSNQGRVYVYDFTHLANATPDANKLINISPTATLSSPFNTGSYRAYFGYSVAADGDLLAVGAPMHNSDVAYATGGLAIYRFNTGTWQEQSHPLSGTNLLVDKAGLTLRRVDGSSTANSVIKLGAQLGYSVAVKNISGGNKLVVVGAPKTKLMNGSNEVATGAGFIVMADSSWNFSGFGLQIINDFGLINNVKYGLSTAASLSGTTLQIYAGSPDIVENLNEAGNGGVDRFVYQGSYFRFDRRISSIRTERSSQFGEVISSSGDYLMVGARNKSNNYGAASIVNSTLFLNP